MMAETPRPTSRPPHILLVDDEPAVLESISDFLIYHDYVVTPVASGSQALQTMKEQAPDLIISDIIMPDMDGYAFYEAVRRNQDWATIPFIFLTACGHQTEVRRGLVLGVDDYLAKPFEPEELLEVIQVRLKRMQQIRQAAFSEVERVKNRLLNVFSHELRTPLTYIYGYVGFLEEQAETFDDDYFNMAVDGLQKGAERLTRLVEDLMLLVRVDSGVAATEIERRHLVVNLSQIMDPLLEQLLSKAEAAQTTLHTEYPESFPLDCVPIYIEEALARLGDNAIKFNKSGGNVWIRVQPQGEEILFSVRDDGVGIAAANLDSVFVRFEQIDRETTEQQGLGLGLTISRALVEAHHGKMWIESTPGQGTIVSFSIPSKQPEPSEDYQVRIKMPKSTL
jgi:signal transduction histidine kinase